MGTSSELRIIVQCRNCRDNISVTQGSSYALREPFLCDVCSPIEYDQRELDFLHMKLKHADLKMSDGEAYAEIHFTEYEVRLMTRLLREKSIS